MASEPVILGRIAGLFGVRGWVKVFSYTEPREAVLQYQGLLICRDGRWQLAEIAEGQRHGKSVIARLENVENRDQAAILIGAELGIKRDAMPTPVDGHYYWSDLIGLRVVHRDGTALGIVDSMLETGAHDVMVLTGEKERLIPFVKDEIVLSVDLRGKLITVDWEWD